MRRRPPRRFDQIIAGALRVFGEKGYRRTQMADVAREMGLSAGTLYNYVSSKEALFHLVVDRAFLPDSASEPKFPVPTPSPRATVQRLRERLATEAAPPALAAALRRERVTNPRAELEAIVRELYALIERTWPAIVVLERSAIERPELAQVFYGEMRRRLVARLARYLSARMARGHLRRAPHPAATARLMLENVAIFAMHRRRDPDPAAMDDDTAREAVVDLLVNALTRPGNDTAVRTRRR